MFVETPQFDTLYTKELHLLWILTADFDKGQPSGKQGLKAAMVRN